MNREELINKLKDWMQKEGVPIKEKNKSGWSYEISLLERNEKTIAETLYKVFKPEISKEDWNEKLQMALSGDGQERLRITTLHSSALLALLFFSGVSKNNPIHIGNNIFDKVYFEVKNKVFKNSGFQDKPSNIDIMLVSPDNKTLLFLESKFTEYGHNGKVEVSEKYHKFYTKLVDYIPELKFGNGILELKEGKNNQYIYGIKQMFSHIIGLLTEPWSGSKDEIKELIKNVDNIELGSIVFNWNQSLYDKYRIFFNSIFHNFEIPKVLDICLDNYEVNKEKIYKISIIQNLLSYQEILNKNPSFKISKEIINFYNF